VVKALPALLVLFILFAAAPAPVTAEVQTTVSVDVFNTVLFSDTQPDALGFARGELDFQSRGNQDVRSRLQIRAFLVDVDGVSTSVLMVPRAEVRWRMSMGETYRPRFTAGRSRLTWGDGVLFNAADTINGARPATVDFTADTLRDETQWLAAGYFPLGRFAFFEPVVLLPGVGPTLPGSTMLPGTDPTDGTTDAEGTTGLTSADPDPAWHTAAGGRVQFNLASVKTELGYLYRGEDEVHQPSVSLQGNLGVDWYLGASLRLPDPPDQELFASAGLYHTTSHPRHGSWSFRLETLWEQAPERLSAFPEITWSPSQLFSLFLRHRTDVLEAGDAALYSDSGHLTTLGFGWNPSTGLTLSLYGTAATDSDNDTYGTVTAAVSYVF
jgi:hypothetical protein